MRILVVDDEIINCKLLERYLARWGYEALSLTDSRDALEIMRTPECPRIAILDWMMPDLDGLEICRAIRQERAQSPLYMMLLTAKTARQDLIEGLEAGADDFIRKPFDPEELKSRIQNAVRIMKLQLELEQRNRENETLLRAIGFALIGLSADQTVTFWNAAAERTFMLAQSVVRGKKLLEIPVLHDRGRIQELVDCARKTGKSVFEEIHVSKPDAHACYFAVSVHLTGSGPGEESGFLVVIEDVTDRKLLEIRMSNFRKLESVGHLAAGIAHEINNPIGFMQSNVSTLHRYIQVLRDYIGILENRVGPDPEAAEGRRKAKIDLILRDVDEIHTDTTVGFERITKIVNGLRGFSRIDSPHFELYNLNKGIENTLAVLHPDLSRHADVKTELASLPEIQAYGSELNHVLLNILMNSIQAIVQKGPGRGHIWIRTFVEDERIICQIADDGTGIPPAILHQIFDPFFTTKDVGKGTGIGLTIAYTTIQKHGGEITAGNRPEGGAVVTFRIPIDAAPSD